MTIPRKRRGGRPEPIPVDVVSITESAREGFYGCRIGHNILFDERGLRSYFFAEPEPILLDALVLCAAIEYCDRFFKRPVQHWARHFAVSLPVYDVDRWSSSNVQDTLAEAINLVTGDYWSFEFRARHDDSETNWDQSLALSREISAVIPFSDGLDSLAVASLLSTEMGDKLVRVRVGNMPSGSDLHLKTLEPFTRIPFRVVAVDGQFRESSARSRGFKFALISGLAAHIAQAKTVFLPESGQGILGPLAVGVGQAYADHRNSPVFTNKMERFFASLLDDEIRFEFPRLWNTKGETLRAYVEKVGKSSGLWKSTRSCWQQSRQVSVDHQRRQCGVCAACMLRRMSIQAAHLEDQPSSYVWENLRTTDFVDAVAPSFRPSRAISALREYAIAGTLHMEHLARLRYSDLDKPSLQLVSFQLGGALRMDAKDVYDHIDELLQRHEREWRRFLDHLGKDSFVTRWAGG